MPRYQWGCEKFSYDSIEFIQGVAMSSVPCYPFSSCSSRFVYSEPVVIMRYGYFVGTAMVTSLCCIFTAYISAALKPRTAPPSQVASVLGKERDIILFPRCLIVFKIIGR